MRTVLQRVSSAQVRVDDEVVGAIGPGLVALVGVTHGDGPDEVATTVRKIAELRLFTPEGDGGERSVEETGGEVLVVSQFTLHADVRKGRRPSWNGAAPAPSPSRWSRPSRTVCASAGSASRPVASAR